MMRSGNKRLVVLLVIAGLVLAGVYGVYRLLTSSVPASVGLDVSAGKIEASNITSTSSTTTTSAEDVFSIRHIAIIVENEHPVLDQVAAALHDALLELKYVDEVDVYTDGRTPEYGGRLYDSYMAMSIDVTQDSKPLLEREFKAKLVITAGGMPYVSHSGYTDHLSPPLARYALTCQLEHSSKSTQVGTPYKMIGENISDEVCKQVTEQFNKWNQQHGSDIDWPDELMGQYPDDTDIPWPDGMVLEKIVDGYGLMSDRHAMWTTVTDEPEKIVQAFHQAYTDAGWKIDSFAILEDNEHHERLHFRAWNDSPYMLEVFEVRDGYDEPKPGEQSRVCVRYLERFDRPEFQPIIDALMQDPANEKVLGYLARHMSDEQEKQYYDSLAQRNISDPKVLLKLVRYQHRVGDDELARQNLVKAYFAAERVQELEQLTEQIEKFGEEIGVEDMNDLVFDRDMLNSMGYQPIEKAASQKQTVGIDEPVSVYYISGGRLQTTDCWLSRDITGENELQCREYTRMSMGGRSWSSHGVSSDNLSLAANHHVSADTGEYSIQFRAVEDEADQYEVEVISQSGAGPPRS